MTWLSYPADSFPKLPISNKGFGSGEKQASFGTAMPLLTRQCEPIPRAICLLNAIAMFRWVTPRIFRLSGDL